VPAVLCAGIIGLAFTMPSDDAGLVQREVSAARPPMP
jgi:hypothetical protein